MSYLSKQISDNESIRLKYFREFLQSEKDVRKQCDLMAELIFGLVEVVQKLREENKDLQLALTIPPKTHDATPDNVPYAGE